MSFVCMYIDTKHEWSEIHVLLSSYATFPLLLIAVLVSYVDGEETASNLHLEKEVTVS